MSSTHLQDEDEPLQLLIPVVFATVTLFSAMLFYLIGKRISRGWQLKETITFLKRKRTISKEVTFVAFEIQNLILKYSDVAQKHFRPVQIPVLTPWSTLKNWYKNFKYFFTQFHGYSPCYALRFAPKAIRKFLAEVKSINDTRAVIYTTLEPEVCDKILTQINLASQFPQEDRIYARSGKLSADEVDPDTGRVVIVSGSADVLDATLASHHGLVVSWGDERMVEEQELGRLGQLFVKLLGNGRVDNLHDDMYELAIEMNLPIRHE